MRAEIARWVTDDDSAPARRLRSRVGGVLFLVGTVIDVAAISGQIGWSGLGRPFVIVTTVLALACGAVVAVTGANVSAIASYAVLSVGVVATGGVQVFLDPATTAGQAAGLIYIWLVVCAALYCTTRATVVQIVLVAVVQGVALGVAGTALWFPQWIMMFGTCVVIATVVNRLALAMRRRAEVDVLTGAATRRALVPRLEEAMRVAERRGTPLAVVMLDLDKFKELNDTLGHAAGDRALAACVAAWRGHLRPGDTLARLGGDEFLAVLPGLGPGDARIVADRLVAAVRGLDCSLACSAGSTQYRTGDTPDDVLHRTDRALYAAKASGGNAAVDGD